MKQGMLRGVAAMMLLMGPLAGCGAQGNGPEPEGSPTAEESQTREPEAEPTGEPAPEPTQEPAPPVQEEWEENFFASESGVVCGFLLRDDGSINEYLCYLPEPSFDTTDGIGQPIDCGAEAFLIVALLDSEVDLYCAIEPTPVGLTVPPGETAEQNSVVCSGLEGGLHCSFPYWERGMGIEVSNDGFIAYMQDEDVHTPGTEEGKEYFLPIPF